MVLVKKLCFLACVLFRQTKKEKIAFSYSEKKTINVRPEK